MNADQVPRRSDEMTLAYQGDPGPQGLSPRGFWRIVVRSKLPVGGLQRVEALWRDCDDRSQAINVVDVSPAPSGKPLYVFQREDTFPASYEKRFGSNIRVKGSIARPRHIRVRRADLECCDTARRRHGHR